MRISLLTFGAIASILSINSVLATTSTVTSKDYVDAADATKQNKLSVNDSETYPYGSVVTYGDTVGNPAAVGVWPLEAFLDNEFTSAQKAAIVSRMGYSQEDLEWSDSMLTTIAGFDFLDTFKQNRIECAGWPDDIPVANRSDSNCWLWNTRSPLVGEEE